MIMIILQSSIIEANLDKIYKSNVKNIPAMRLFMSERGVTLYAKNMEATKIDFSKGEILKGDFIIGRFPKR